MNQLSSVAGGFYHFLCYENISEGHCFLCSHISAWSGRRNLVRCDSLQLHSVCSCLLLCKVDVENFCSLFLFFPIWVKKMQNSSKNYGICMLNATSVLVEKWGNCHWVLINRNITSLLSKRRQIKPKTWETRSMVTAKEQVFGGSWLLIVAMMLCVIFFFSFFPSPCKVFDLLLSS